MLVFKQLFTFLKCVVLLKETVNVSDYNLIISKVF